MFGLEECCQVCVHGARDLSLQLDTDSDKYLKATAVRLKGDDRLSVAVDGWRQKVVGISPWFSTLARI